MAVVISKSDFDRIASAVRKIEGQVERSSQSGSSPSTEIPTRWFVLTEDLGESQVAEAKLVIWEAGKTASGVVNPVGACGTDTGVYRLPVDAKVVKVRGNGKYWGLAGDCGRARLIPVVRSGKIEPEWEIDVNPGRDVYCGTVTSETFQFPVKVKIATPAGDRTVSIVKPENDFRRGSRMAQWNSESLIKLEYLQVKGRAVHVSFLAGESGSFSDVNAGWHIVDAMPWPHSWTFMVNTPWPDSSNQIPSTSINSSSNWDLFYSADREFDVRYHSAVYLPPWWSCGENFFKTTTNYNTYPWQVTALPLGWSANLSKVVWVVVSFEATPQSIAKFSDGDLPNFVGDWDDEHVS